MADCKICERRAMPGRRYCREHFNQNRRTSASRQADVDAVSEVVEEHRLKRRVRELEDQVKRLTSAAFDRGELADIWRQAQGSEPVRSIRPRERKSHLAEATPLIVASDWHIEEEVRSEQVAGRNRYDLDISARRMERFFEASLWAIRHQRDVFKIRDVVVGLIGDIITNYIHADNVETNLLSPVEAIAYAHEAISKGVRYWLTDPEVERWVFVCMDGNHGRLTKDLRAGSRVQNSIEWLLYAMLKRTFADEPRVEFQLPTSQFSYFDVYGRTVRFTHGDTIRYAGGVGGLTVPLFRAIPRWDSTIRADLTVLGHFHQRYCLPNAIVNGSMIGYNTYAMASGFPYEPPVQCMRILDPRRFSGADIPLWVSERTDDALAR